MNLARKDLKMNEGGEPQFKTPNENLHDKQKFTPTPLKKQHKEPVFG